MSPVQNFLLLLFSVSSGKMFLQRGSILTGCSRGSFCFLFFFCRCVVIYGRGGKKGERMFSQLKSKREEADFVCVAAERASMTDEVADTQMA